MIPPLVDQETKAPTRKGLFAAIAGIAVAAVAVLWLFGGGGTPPPAQAEAEAEPQPTVAPSRTPRPRIANPGTGDVNSDGFVDKDDVEYLVEHLMARGSEPIGEADVNGDGKVDMQDVFKLKAMAFAVEPTRPPGTPGAQSTSKAP